ncbi:MAG: hypothetical protein NUW24_02900 [Anaerolineae bacterium]|jgi:hypothetical protein|nr:hypothetical protein [Anaerolineae bacterium]MDH7473365.1 hypothetical protein [Anaerolineae bacterium]
MAYGAGGAAAAAAAAEEHRRMMLAEEEENMTHYTPDDLNNDWEFKIVRSGTGAFRKAEVLNKLIEEEARAGWIMLEKFDDYRIRFKRPRSARAKDAYLPAGVDPYRTRYGASVAPVVLVVLGIVLVLSLALGLLFFVLASRL